MLLPLRSNFAIDWTNLVLRLLLPDAWPHYNTAADEAVAAACQVRGVVVAADAGWDAEDFVVALDARIPYVKGALCTYKTCIQKLNDKLFKGKQKAIAFDKHEDVARSLKAVGREVDHMLDSAFRSGVQAALSIAKSWYPGIDLQLMTALREGSE